MTTPAHQAASIIRDRAARQPRLALVLGSGLGALADRIEHSHVVPYEKLPGFPKSTVVGHAGRLVIGTLAGLPVVCLQGRRHFYEGGSSADIVQPIRALKLAGIETLFLTNAAGSLRPEVGAGRLMLIEDHINFQPGNPLIGPNDDAFGPRFPPMRDAYDPALRRQLKAAAKDVSIDLSTGTYFAYSGPSFETPAEIRMFQRLGGDAVGMSTVPECIVARHCGLRVCAVSVITNVAEGLTDESPSHEHTLAMAERAAGDLGRLVERFCAAYDQPASA